MFAVRCKLYSEKKFKLNVCISQLSALAAITFFSLLRSLLFYEFI